MGWLAEYYDRDPEPPAPHWQDGVPSDMWRDIHGRKHSIYEMSDIRIINTIGFIIRNNDTHLQVFRNLINLAADKKLPVPHVLGFV